MSIAKPLFIWNGVDLSAWVRDAVCEFAKRSVESTSSTSNTETTEPSLTMVDPITVTFKNPSEAGGAEATIWDDFVAGTTRQIEVRPGQGVAAAGNPKYVGPAYCSKIPVVKGAPGDLREVTYEFKPTGDFARAVA